MLKICQYKNIRYNSNINCIITRCFGFERAGKSVKPGAALVLDGVPHRVTKITQGKRGKGGGFVKAVVKNLVSSNSYEKTFTSDENVEIADLEKEQAQYSWLDDNNYVFMNSETYEEVRVPVDNVDNKAFLVEGQNVKLLKFRDNVIGVELPNIYEYIVTIVDDSLQGKELATLNNGTVITVPAFVKVGQKIKVNTIDGLYVGRAEE